MTAPADERHDEHQGEGEHGKPGDKKPPGAKKPLKDRKELLIVIVSIVGVFITYLIYRSQSAGAATTSFTGGQGTLGNGTLAGGDTGAADGLSSLIDSQSALLAEIEATLKKEQRAINRLPKKMNHPPHHHKPPHGGGKGPSGKPHFIMNWRAQHLKFIKDDATGKIGEVMKNGKVFWLNARQYAELGRPHYTEYHRHAHDKPPHHKPPPKKHHRVWGHP